MPDAAPWRWGGETVVVEGRHALTAVHRVARVERPVLVRKLAAAKVEDGGAKPRVCAALHHFRREVDALHIAPKVGEEACVSPRSRSELEQCRSRW